MNIENLKSKLIYNQETGIFTWAKSQGAAKAGVIAGALHKQGYWVIGFESKIYSAHRLAWAITSGELPQMIDHINGNKLDNRIKNLRNVDNTLNQHNRKTPRKDCIHGFMGISFRPKSKNWNKDKWQASIRVDGKRISLGYFDTPEEAQKVYFEEKIKRHSGFVKSEALE